ncbi:hypothetical protein QVD17_07783 [Tagetes erecta]|uniref:F-box domain-containing protein n=1 Tax=Tagetes erecta TaxID=13708 RepID=A0AAD8P458_TARER|nr:hypothetical protein QVD17_07783 [Tagetes erecta]
MLLAALLVISWFLSMKCNIKFNVCLFYYTISYFWESFQNVHFDLLFFKLSTLKILSSNVACRQDVDLSSYKIGSNLLILTTLNYLMHLQSCYMFCMNKSSSSSSSSSSSPNMEEQTLEQQSTDDQSHQKPKISFPIEIIEDILSRLPIKTLLQYRSVSKPWLQLISDPSFTKLHFTRSNHRSALFISAYDRSTHKRYFLSASINGGPIAHVATIANVPASTAKTSQSEHLNGLVCFTSANGSLSSNYAFVVNPSTHKVFKVPNSVNWNNQLDGEWNTCYLFGFDLSRNEHKILNIRIRNYRLVNFSSITGGVEVLIFSMSSYTWRKIDVKFPVDCLRCVIKCSVCVDSVIHFMVDDSFEIIMFDLRTETFSIVRIPDDVVARLRTEFMTSPRIVKVKGCVGVVCSDIERNEMHVWTLRDCERRVWVRETIAFFDIELGGVTPLDFVDTDEIIHFYTRVPRNVINVYVYNMKNRGFKTVQLTLSQPFLCLDDVVFDEFKCYDESIASLERKRTRT